MVTACPTGWTTTLLNDILWRQDRGTMSTAANVCACFIGEPCSWHETKLRRLTSDTRRASTSPGNRATLSMPLRRSGQNTPLTTVKDGLGIQHVQKEPSVLSLAQDFTLECRFLSQRERPRRRDHKLKSAYAIDR
ncbi:hypothetical protein PoB_007121300 [Plakobranchus ocellatus]|uniref:Uncharacterized protein n=1 Tax=Plakobranchus ocellatus TaxID=259542 RepID=A0AAV4DKV8_9GAST|nr:hypothetical protein PoB_007121300 [Plakobranchus ocellatus]